MTAHLTAHRMHRRLVLASSVAGAAIAALDGTVLTVVQPTLQRELGASLAVDEHRLSGRRGKPVGVGRADR